MRAVVYSRTGDPDVLTLVDLPMPAPADGEVRVKVHRAGVNPTDWKSRRGAGLGGRRGLVDPPQIPGQDGAGVVDAVGVGVDAGLLGRRVWIWEAAYGRSQGTTAEQVVVPAGQVVPLPDGVAFDVGAGLGIPFLTAHRCLTVTEDGPTTLGPGTLAGRVVLVAGGAGAVGNAAIQLARWSDATVISTVSGPAKARMATAAGADATIDYRRQDVVAEVRRVAPAGVNTVIEVSPSVNAAIDVAVIARHGSVAVYANDGGPEMTVPVGSLMVPNARWQFVLVYTAPAEAKERAIADVSGALAAGAIRLGADVGMPLHHFPLADAAAAHAAVERSVVGKVLIDVVPG